MVCATWVSTNSSQTSLLKSLWVELHFKVWEHRNDWVHKPGGWTEQRELPSIDSAIRREFDAGKDTLDREQVLILKKPLEEVLQLSLPQNKQWLDMVERSREAFHSKQSMEQWRFDHERAVMKRFLNQE